MIKEHRPDIQCTRHPLRDQPSVGGLPTRTQIPRSEPDGQQLQIRAVQAFIVFPSDYIPKHGLKKLSQPPLFAKSLHQRYGTQDSEQVLAKSGISAYSDPRIQCVCRYDSRPAARPASSLARDTSFSDYIYRST
jgi:hypothetical protein